MIRLALLIGFCSLILEIRGWIKSGFKGRGVLIGKLLQSFQLDTLGEVLTFKSLVFEMIGIYLLKTPSFRL